MSPLPLVLAALLSGVPEGGQRWYPPPVEHGWDLQETWDDTWRRFQDRNGRPDPQGPLLQPSPELQTHEYELTLAVAQQPFYLERDWTTRDRGARLFINSDDEFNFFNEVRLKERIPLGSVAAFGIRLDRRQLREIDSTMVRLDIAFPDIAGTGLFVEVRPVARLEKPDLDAELLVGWARPEQGRVVARAFFFDPANNASDALAQNRENPVDIRVLQRGPVIGLSGEAELSRIPNLTLQAYAGGLLPARQSLWFADEAKAPYDRQHSAVLGGGWAEVALPMAPVRIGASAMAVRALELQYTFAGARIDQTTQELDVRARAYAMAEVGEDTRGYTILEAAVSYRRTQLPEHTSQWGSVVDDRSWLAQLRATWMPTRVFGLEVGYFFLDRAAQGEGDLAPFLTAQNHRLSTRFAFMFNPWLRATFGVGWDLDDEGNRYDKGGLTLSARW